MTLSQPQYIERRKLIRYTGCLASDGGHDVGTAEGFTCNHKKKEKNFNMRGNSHYPH